MKHCRWILLLLFFVLLGLPTVKLSATNDTKAESEFVTLSWQADTTKLGLTFPEASFPTGSLSPIYTKQFELGINYASQTYSVSIDYPEYQALDIPKGLEQWAKSLPEDPTPETILGVANHNGSIWASLVPFIYRNGKLMRLNSFQINLSIGVTTTSVRRTILTTKATTTSDFTTTSVLSTGKWVKISIPKTGVFKLTNTQLKSMGFSDPAKVRLYGYGGALLNEALKNHTDDLSEVQMWKEDGYVLFYGQGPVSWEANSANTYFTRTENFYANAGYYFLTEGTESTTFPSTEVTQTASTTLNTYNDYALYENNEYNWASSGRELYESYNYATTNTKSYAFSLPGITTDSGYCTARFAALSTSTTTVSVTANSLSIGSFTIGGTSDEYSKAIDAGATFEWTSGQVESTTIKITHTRSSGVPGRLNYIALNFRRNLKQYGNYTPFRDLTTKGKIVNYQIASSSSSTVVWDVTTMGGYQQMKGTLSGSTYSFVGDNTTVKEYVAVDVNGTFASPTIVGSIENQDLHALEQPDFVIVIPASGIFQAQAERLAQAHRDKDNMVVHVVRADQVYNEYSSGTPDATAFRWFMKQFYDRAQTNGSKSPRYLLMMGDCAWDNRMVTSDWKGSSPEDFLPCYESPNSTIEVQSYCTDDYLALLDSGEGTSLITDKMDIGVGRFTVRTLSQATTAVDKTIAYMNNTELGPWKNRICYAADDGDSATDGYPHMTYSEELAKATETNYPAFLVSRIYEDAYIRETTSSGFAYPQATKELLSTIENGALVVNYVGHGGTSGWSAEFLLTSEEILAMQNTKLGLWITATCDFCRYDDVSTSAGEYAFLNSSGGAIALFTTSRVVYGSNNHVLHTQFNNFIYQTVNGSHYRLGDIIQLAKNKISDMNKLNFSLIGDPALKLNYPEQKVVLDSLNGMAVENASSLQMRAGEIIRLSGHVTDYTGSTLSDYKGLIYPSVYDAIESVSTYQNNGEETPFTYKEYSKKLFGGNDSIQNGKFSISFPVPLDISYSNAAGMINFYATNIGGEKEAQGTFKKFIVGGSVDDAMKTDSVGPTIWAYLNTPDFTNGDVTGTKPVLYATLSDEEGINTTGNGIGHDITAVLDNSPVYSYVLNNYFTLSSGSYKEGTLAYQFDALEEGKHTLVLTAWDLKNNASQHTLSFNVSSQAAPTITQASCYPVPATSQITFYFVHNQPKAVLNISIEVFNFNGERLWTHSISEIAASSACSYTWDLTTNGGARLPQGVYLYRMKFSTEESDETTETLKFVVGAQ